MNKPQSIEEAQQIIEKLQTQLAEANKNKKVKEPVLMVEYETGNLQIRRLTGKSINLPTFVIRWILEHAQQILSFITANQELLAGQNDTEAMTQSRLQLRAENLTTDNPVVRKPRAKNETQEF
jgi:hypothetical protein